MTQFMSSVLEQQQQFERIYSENLEKFAYHTTPDKLTRYLRDRRLHKGLDFLKSQFSETALNSWRVLVVCGGVGGEGFFFLRNGFKDVSSSDFSSNSLEIAQKLDPTHSLKTILINAEDVGLPDGSFDLVVVQDGLHHLPRPSLGFTEMLRVASKAIIVIEPYNSAVGNMIGTEWEQHGDAINFVYRWDRFMVEQTVKSYLLKHFGKIKVIRLWDHTISIRRITNRLPFRLRLGVARLVYGILRLFSFSGNMMIAIVVK